jgi:hypothetical protein
MFTSISVLLLEKVAFSEMVALSSKGLLDRVVFPDKVVELSCKEGLPDRVVFPDEIVELSCKEGLLNKVVFPEVAELSRDVKLSDGVASSDAVVFDEFKKIWFVDPPKSLPAVKSVGCAVGEVVVISVGTVVKISVGEVVGTSVGTVVKISVGEVVGTSVGTVVKISVGEVVGTSVGTVV